MTEFKLPPSPKIMNELVHALGQAAGAATQLLHQHQDPRWMPVRAGIEGAKEIIALRATIPTTRITGIRPL